MKIKENRLKFIGKRLKINMKIVENRLINWNYNFKNSMKISVFASMRTSLRLVRGISINHPVGVVGGRFKPHRRWGWVEYR